MSKANRSSTYGCLAAFLLVLGICSMCGGAFQGFGDRMPNPPPEIQAQFEETNRRIGFMFGGGMILAFSGAVCAAVAVTRSQKKN